MKVFNRGPRAQAIATKTGVVTVPASTVVTIDDKVFIQPKGPKAVAYKANACFFNKADADEYDGEQNDLATKAEENAKLAKEANEALTAANKAQADAKAKLAEAEQMFKDAEALNQKTAEEKAEAEKLLDEAKELKTKEPSTDGEKTGQQGTKSGTQTATK